MIGNPVQILGSKGTDSQVIQFIQKTYCSRIAAQFDVHSIDTPTTLDSPGSSIRKWVHGRSLCYSRRFNGSMGARRRSPLIEGI